MLFTGLLISILLTKTKILLYDKYIFYSAALMINIISISAQIHEIILQLLLTQNLNMNKKIALITGITAKMDPI